MNHFPWPTPTAKQVTTEMECVQKKKSVKDDATSVILGATWKQFYELFKWTERNWEGRQASLFFFLFLRQAHTTQSWWDYN